jgi:hypothetical protein
LDLIAFCLPNQVFGITAVFPLLVSAISLNLAEEKVVSSQTRGEDSADAMAGGATTTGDGATARNGVIARDGALGSFGAQVGDQAALLWGAVSQRRVWLPALFMLLWQGTPSSGGAFFYFLTDELGFGPEFLGRVSVGTSIASLVGWLRLVQIGPDWSRLRPMGSGRCECA